MASRRKKSESSADALKKTERKRKTASPAKKSTKEKAVSSKRKTSSRSKKETSKKTPARAKAASSRTGKKPVSSGLKDKKAKTVESSGLEHWVEEIYRILGFPENLSPEAQKFFASSSSGSEAHVAALARDAFWLFVFWEIPAESLSDVARDWDGKLKEASFVLRLYEMEDSGVEKLVEEIVLSHPRNSHYLRVPRSGRTYRVQIGVRSRSGEFFLLAESGLVRMPTAASPAGKGVDIAKGALESYYASAGGEASPSSPDSSFFPRPSPPSDWDRLD